MTVFEPHSTALILIDLQKGIVDRAFYPRDCATVVKEASRLADRFRAAGAPVVLVNVAWSKDGGDMLRQPVDQPTARNPADMPAGWSDLIPDIVRPGDIRVTKHQWGAFYATDLEVQLRRRGIRTVVIGGVATNMGVESTARQAWEYGYDVVIAEETTASKTVEMHRFAIDTILPMISRVLTSADITLTAG